MKTYDISKLKDNLTAEIGRMATSAAKPVSLLILLGTESPDAEYYADSLVKKGKKLGIPAKIERYSGKAGFDSVIKKIDRDPSVSAIALSPYPADLDFRHVSSGMPLNKDADCSGYRLAGSLFWGFTDIAPATAKSVFLIASEFFGGDMSGKHAVICGRSVRVGKPLVPLLLSINATVTICHSKTADIASLTKAADCVICAIGRPGFFKRGHFSPGQLVIDVGINKTETGFTGDVDTGDIEDSDITLTPVKNGVGTLTSLLIYKNLLDLLHLQE